MQDALLLAFFRILHLAPFILPGPPFDSPAHDVIEIALQSRIPQHTRSSHAVNPASTAAPCKKIDRPHFLSVPIFVATLVPQVPWKIDVGDGLQTSDGAHSAVSRYCPREL
jgi:hypothetical protein